MQEPYRELAELSVRYDRKKLTSLQAHLSFAQRVQVRRLRDLSHR